jgi:hypothetical protein
MATLALQQLGEVLCGTNTAGDHKELMWTGRVSIDSSSNSVAITHRRAHVETLWWTLAVGGLGEGGAFRNCAWAIMPAMAKGHYNTLAPTVRLLFWASRSLIIDVSVSTCSKLLRIISIFSRLSS